MSLRSRLMAAFIVVALALIGADFAVGLLVHHALLSTVDSRLDVQRGVPRPDAPPPTGATPGGGGAFFERGISDLYVAYIDPTGVVQSRNANTLGRNVKPPKLDTPTITAHTTPLGQVAKPFSLSGEDSGYRAVALKTTRGGTIVIAVSLKDTDQTFNRVLLVEAIASIFVLLALGLVAWWVLHLGVRPLSQMAQTAEQIAAGDLSKRVERAEHRTEAGRLGLALNAMLGEIERAFDERGASEERLRRFIADASHELRTPLTSIRGYAELWRQGGLETESQRADAMRRMEQEAARMGVLVDDMLLLARLDQGRPLEMTPVDLAVITRDAVADALAVEPDRPLSLDAPDHVVVQGDDHRLHQVVANLLANERVHTPTSTAVRVALRSDGNRATLVVEDDGPGFGPQPERVFERFYRTDPARARSSGGTGLGLSIVASVVEAHGGKASAGASASGGARICVELPLAPRGQDLEQGATTFA